MKYFGNSTLSIGRYSAVTDRSISPRVRRTLLCHTNFSPSITPDTTPSGWSSGSGRSAPGSLSTAIVRMDKPNAAAVTHMVFTPPIVAINRPPMPGPVM